MSRSPMINPLSPRKLLDVGRLGELGWRAATGLRQGIALAYRDFLNGSR